MADKTSGHRIRALLALGVAGCVLVASGCSSSKSSNGEDKKAGPQVAKDAAEALTAAKAVRVTGTLPDATSGKTLELDLELQPAATSGTLKVLGSEVEIITVSDTSYVKSDAAFYKSQGVADATAATLAGKWVKAPSGSEFSTFTLTQITKEISAPPAGTTINDKTTTEELDGDDVVVTTRSDGSKLYVAATGTPVPRKLLTSATSAGTRGKLMFGDYNKTHDIQAPQGAVDAGTQGS